MIAECHVVDIDDIDKLGELSIQLADRRIGTGDYQCDPRDGRIIGRGDVEGIDVVATGRKHSGHARQRADLVLQQD